MHTRAAHWAAGLSFLLLTACSSAMQGGGPAADESVITEQDLREATAANLFDYIRSRRPRWLERNYSAVMRPERVTTVMVFMDNQEFGGPDALRQIPLTVAVEVRYFGPSESQARFGVGYLNGVIQVLSRAAR
jgi:hypothetical protein